MKPAAAARNAVDGVLLLDKPRGLTSQQAVARAKRLFNARKAGHTGTLDPLADGLLPIGLGEATKFSQFLLDADKRYLATLRLGITTTTGDAEGEVIKELPVAVTPEQLSAVLPRFTGPQRQIPPMHAAIKVDGKPLYAYARAGETVTREPRSIIIKSIQIIDFIDKNIKLRISCSKGTYIRVLAEDIGAALGCGAHLSALTREAAGGLDLANAVSLAKLETMTLPQRLERLLPADTFAASLPRLELSADHQRRLMTGQPVRLGEAAPPGLFRLYGAAGAFFGIGEAAEGALTARRLLTQSL
ncbi:MAG: tRNA pseudouridine(55) synthase TruB [Burkholderiales bacterium]|nr:tRNA pseudouridine(55) synthase TruB [Burkholderiales bacterium]